jgi:hypothetical protein
MQVRYLVSFSGFFLGEETTQKPKKKKFTKRETNGDGGNKQTWGRGGGVGRKKTRVGGW